ncbi:MAG: metal ABC transporter solute-binding protein, Zn/Mn family [Thermodesulfobacteriota bacterium]
MNKYKKQTTIMLKQKLSALAFILQIIILTLSVSSAHCAGDKITAIASILPQKHFINKIGGDHVETKVMVKPGASPATYEPTPTQMVSLTEAEVYFAIGVPFEDSWLPKIDEVNPKMKVVNTQEGIAKHTILGNTESSREKKGILDPHIWLAPSLVRIQARNIRNGLIEADPENKNDYVRNYASFVREINKVDEKLLDLFCENPGRNHFMVFHPSWGYLARSYGLIQVTIEVEGKKPGPRQLSALVQKARELKLNTVFVQPQFSAKSAKVIADAINGQVVKIDPLAENWAENLIEAAQKIKNSMQLP